MLDDVLSENGQLKRVIITLIGRIKKSLTFPFYQMCSLACSSVRLSIWEWLCLLFIHHDVCVCFFSSLIKGALANGSIRRSIWVTCVLWEAHFVWTVFVFMMIRIFFSEFNSNLLYSFFFSRLLLLLFLPLPFLLATVHHTVHDVAEKCPSPFLSFIHFFLHLSIFLSLSLSLTRSGQNHSIWWLRQR